MEVADTALDIGLSEPVPAARPELADRVLAFVRQTHDATGQRQSGVLANSRP
ncbi:hypothetical protein [Streptomyces sioyaensis]|uniref:hypothetical protein n=1 Tax=Streptomyces sioyaensis TaxID=67364 RepID=UPI0037993280